MGGVHSSLLAGLDPAITVATPISPGGGLLEVGLRTELGGVTRATILPILGPMIVTVPKTSNPEIHNVVWLVHDVNAKRLAPFAAIGRLGPSGEVIDELRPGDVFVVTNRTNGEVDRVVVNDARKVRAHIPADKGDLIEIDVFRAGASRPYREIRTFEYEIGFQGATYASGETLIAIQEGLGLRRNTPSLRRMIGLSQMILEPGDPANYAVHYGDPLFVRPEGAVPTNVLLILTMGDMALPISAGVALGRAAGVIGYRNVDPRYGKTQNQLLIDTHVVEAVEKLRYFENDPCHWDDREVNFDIDDLSDGLHPDVLPVSYTHLTLPTILRV